MADWNTKSGKENYYRDDYLIKLYHTNSMHSKELLSINVPNENAHIKKNTVEYKSVIDLGDTNDEKYRIEQNLSDTLLRRRTSWNFKGSMKQEELYKLLINSFGGIDDWLRDKPIRKRTYPSGGALYPIRPYILINYVEGFQGNELFCFDGATNQLKLIRDDMDASQMYRYTSMTYSHMNDYQGASIFIFFVTDLTETMPKYGLLSYRLSLIETGHMAENLMLSSAAMNFVSVPFGGIFEAELNDYIGLKEETVLYFYAVG